MEINVKFGGRLRSKLRLNRGYRRGLILAAIVAGLCGAGNSALAATTVTPNPVTQGGTINVTPDASCISAMSAFDPSESAWIISYSDGTLISYVPYEPIVVSIEAGLDPGTYLIRAGTLSPDGGTITLVAACGQVSFVVAADGNVPIVDPKVGLAAGALGLGVVAAIRRRRRTGAGI
jgi:MYXO-CTERM domain-containing protein